MTRALSRALGIDPGKKRIGVAITDELGVTAQPLTFIKATTRNKDIEEILALADEHGAGIIVVGVAYNMNGTTGPAARRALDFIAALQEKTDKSVVPWDERLSTAAVTRVLIQGDVSRSKRKQVVDKLAAAYILEGWLESKQAD